MLPKLTILIKRKKSGIELNYSMKKFMNLCQSKYKIIRENGSEKTFYFNYGVR